MTSIVPFVTDAVFEPADFKTMSEAYNRAIERIGLQTARVAQFRSEFGSACGWSDSLALEWARPFPRPHRASRTESWA